MGKYESIKDLISSLQSAKVLTPAEALATDNGGNYLALLEGGNVEIVWVATDAFAFHSEASQMVGDYERVVELIRM